MTRPHPLHDLPVWLEAVQTDVRELLAEDEPQGRLMSPGVRLRVDELLMAIDELEVVIDARGRAMSTEPDPEPRTTHRHSGWHEHSLTDLGDATEPHTHAATPSSATPDLRAALDTLQEQVRDLYPPHPYPCSPQRSGALDQVMRRIEAIRLASVTPSEPTRADG